VWRNGRRTGLKIEKTALSGHFFGLLATHAKLLYLLVKKGFYAFFKRHHLGRDFTHESSTKSSTRRFCNPLNINISLDD